MGATFPAAALTVAMSAAGNLPTDGFRQEHVEVRLHLDHVQKLVDAVAANAAPDPRAAMREAVDALSTHLIPHAQWEDRVLYPLIDEKAGTALHEGGVGNRFTAAPRHEHVIVARWLAELRTLADAAQLDTASFARGANQLLGLVRAHFEVEEKILLPVLDQTMTREEVDQRLGAEGTHEERGAHTMDR